jgi:hypothetical protein
LHESRLERQARNILQLERGENVEGTAFYARTCQAGLVILKAT